MTSRQTNNLVPAAIKKAMFRDKAPSPDDIRMFLGRFAAQCGRAPIDASGITTVEIPGSWARFLEWALLRYRRGEARSLDAAFLLSHPGAPARRAARNLEIATEMLRFRRSPEARKRGAITHFQERLAEVHRLTGSSKVREIAKKLRPEAEEALYVEGVYARRNAALSAAGRE